MAEKKKDFVLSSSFPLKIFTIGLVVTVLIILYLGIYSWRSYQSFQEAEDEITLLQQTTNEVRKNNDLMLLGLSTAAGDGTSIPMEIFEKMAADFEESLPMIADLATDATTKNAASQAIVEFEKLHEASVNSIAGLEEGSSLDLASILNNPEYQQQTQVYLDSVNNLSLAIQSSIDNEIHDRHLQLLIVSLIIAGALLVVIAIWYFVLKKIQAFIKERDQADEALRESEERFRLLFGNMQEAAWYISLGEDSSVLESQTEYVSPQIETTTGYKPEDFTSDSSTWFNALHPDDAADVSADTERIVREKKIGHRVYRMLHRDTGEDIWLEENVVPRIDAEGNVIGLFGISRDITERRTRDDLLINIARGVAETTGKAFFTSMVTNLNKAIGADVTYIGELDEKAHSVRTIAVSTPDGVGDNFEYDLAGTPCENVIGQKVCIYPSAVQDKFPQDQDLVEMGIEAYIGAPLFDSSSNPLGILVVLFRKPVTDPETAEQLLKIFAARAGAELERLVAEEALSLSEAKYRNLFEETKDAVYMASREGRFIDMNQAGIDLLAYDSLEEVCQLDLASDVYADPEDRDRFQQDLVESGYLRDYEIDLVRKDGERRTFSVTATLVYDEDGAIIGNWGIGRDITEHQRMEEQLIQAQKMESIGRLAGGVAHDFNNFLTAVQGYIEMAISDLPLNSPVKPELVEAARSADRAVDVTRQLLLFSRHGQMNPRAVNLNSVVEGIQSMLNRLIGEQYEITTTLDQRIQKVKADSGNIEQVLLNLIVNARDAMPDGGRIIVGTQNLELEVPVADMSGMEHMGEYTCLWVQDAGEGMDDTVRSKIFEPFFSTKSVSTGTGLGLSVVYGIVEQHNGWVEVESQPGVGSTFRIYLPVMSEDASIAADPTAVIQEDLHGRGEKVLLVEDEEVVRNLAMKMLAGSGFEVAAAADAREAIELFNRSGGDFQLLFCDVVLPGVTGVRLADDLRKDNPDLQVLLVSGYTGDVIDHAEIIKKGYRFLQKPYSLADLLIEINNLLHNKGQ